MRESLEYVAAWILVKLLGILPRSLARTIGAEVGTLAYRLLGRLREVAMTNLALAFPEKSVADHER
ncbi:MAG TPA: hypothetical protein VK670_03000, partial [Silvibacterium sp.]|nr:hypothetical protein [Silvibacterium sp.]